MSASSCHCKFEHVCAALTASHTPHMVYHHHHYHDHRRVEREEGHEAVPRVDKGFVNRLTPPITTSFFHKETLNIFSGQGIYTDSMVLLPPSETVTWRTEVYKYVTRMRPDDPNFKQNGGEIFIVMVHGGTSETGALPKFKYSKKIKVPPSIIPMKQYPASNSGVQSGDDWSYNIDYTNVMPMFSNGGNTVFDFEASYKEDFVRSKFKQTGIETNDGVEFAAVEPQDIRIDDHPIIGLSVFKCLDPTIFPVKFTFEASIHAKGTIGTEVLGSISKEVMIDFDFFPVLACVSNITRFEFPPR